MRRAAADCLEEERARKLSHLSTMYEGRIDEQGGHSNEKYYQYENQQYEPYTTVMGQSGIPLNIPYGLFQYAKYQEDPRNVKIKDTLRRVKWTVRHSPQHSPNISAIRIHELRKLI